MFMFNFNYGRMQNGESLLFYTDGLVLLGRSKVFNDFPPTYYAQLINGASFGDAWAAYFAFNANLDWGPMWDEGDETEATIDIRRKKSYPWNLIGDWTLTLDH